MTRPCAKCRHGLVYNLYLNVTCKLCPCTCHGPLPNLGHARSMITTAASWAPRVSGHVTPTVLTFAQQNARWAHPVALGDCCKWGLQAAHVVPSITFITQQHLCRVILRNVHNLALFGCDGVAAVFTSFQMLGVLLSCVLHTSVLVDSTFQTRSAPLLTCLPRGLPVS